MSFYPNGKFYTNSANTYIEDMQSDIKKLKKALEKHEAILEFLRSRSASTIDMVIERDKEFEQKVIEIMYRPDMLGGQKSIENLQNNYTKLESKETADLECCICKESVDYIPDECNPCKHNNFHMHCMNKWLKNSSSCPYCSQQVSAYQGWVIDPKKQNISHEIAELLTTL